MSKEIVISKKALKNNIIILLLSFPYSVVIMFIITVFFGDFVFDSYRYFNNGEVCHYYYNSLLNQEYYGYDPVLSFTPLSGYIGDVDMVVVPPHSLSSSDIFYNYYLPFVFMENFLLLVAVTITLVVIIKLSRFFTIKFK